MLLRAVVAASLLPALVLVLLVAAVMARVGAGFWLGALRLLAVLVVRASAVELSPLVVASPSSSASSVYKERGGRCH